MRLRLPGVVLVAVASLLSMPMRGQQTNASQSLPPISYVCPMPQDAAVVEDKPGKCPLCKMDLVAVRLDSKFWCPTHQTLVVRDAAGKCPLDQKDLVQVTLSEYWTCADKPNERLLEPGRCAGGQPRKITFEVRAHGDHNPRHDGQFFMAEDQWHHLEGTYPRKGLFRAFFYDNFTQPLAPKTFKGSVVLLGDKDTELGTVPLKLSRNGETLEADIPAKLSELPLKAAALIQFDPKLRTQKFNFVFTQYSKDPVAPTPATTTGARPTANSPATASNTAPRTAPKVAAIPAPAAATNAAPPTPAAATAPTPGATPPAPAVADAAQTSAGAEQAAPGSDQTPVIMDKPIQIIPAVAEALDESRLPGDTAGLLAELSRRAGEVEALVNEGNLSQVWLPATGTKTVALVLESHARSFPERQRTIVTFAVKRIVTAVWELDAYGDLGNKQKLTEAYARMASALTDLKAAYETR